MRTIALVISALALGFSVLAYVLVTANQSMQYQTAVLNNTEFSEAFTRATLPASTTTIVTSNGKTTITTTTTKRVMVIKPKGTDREIRLTLKEYFPILKRQP